MTSPVFGVKLLVALVICILLMATLFYIICKLRKNSSAANLSDDEIVYNNFTIEGMSFSRNEWNMEMRNSTPECCDGKINGDDHDDHSSNVRCIASDARPFGLREIEAATNGLAIEKIIGSGEFGVAYHGLLMDNRRVVIKKLFNNRREEKEFSSLAEAILLIRHKNVVKMLGYCAEGPYRMLVHEYVDNGNLEQWLHNCKSETSPLTWSIRMHIIKGIANGLTYLHEETKPPISHFNLKSSNVLIDQHWNPKISNIGTTRFLGPEYDYTHVIDEKSDVYSFGVLIMEIVSGKSPIQTYQNEIEEYLVDWIKYMVDGENFGRILDPSLPRLPTVEEVKRILLIAIRCVDFEAKKRPKMRDIVKMLDLRGLFLLGYVI